MFKERISFANDELIARSRIFKKKNGSELEFTIQRCSYEDFESIVELQQIAYENIEDKETFVLTSEDELAESLIHDYCIGAYQNDILIAVTIMVSNRYNYRNLGYSLGYNKEKCHKCVTFDTTFIHPSYFGYGIQRFFIGIRDDIARSLGAVEALVSVSPRNSNSLNNVLAGGFSIVEEKKIYGDFHRYILRKKNLRA